MTPLEILMLADAAAAIALRLVEAFGRRPLTPDTAEALAAVQQRLAEVYLRVMAYRPEPLRDEPVPPVDPTR